MSRQKHRVLSGVFGMRLVFLTEVVVTTKERIVDLIVAAGSRDRLKQVTSLLLVLKDAMYPVCSLSNKDFCDLI